MIMLHCWCFSLVSLDQQYVGAPWNNAILSLLVTSVATHLVTFRIMSSQPFICLKYQFQDENDMESFQIWMKPKKIFLNIITLETSYSCQGKKHLLLMDELIEQTTYFGANYQDLLFLLYITCAYI